MTFDEPIWWPMPACCWSRPWSVALISSTSSMPRCVSRDVWAVRSRTQGPHLRRTRWWRGFRVTNQPADVLRSGASSAVLPHRVMAPSTLGPSSAPSPSVIVRQLDSVLTESLRRGMVAWGGAGQFTSDSWTSTRRSVRYTASKRTERAYGYTHVLGYHPLIATWAETGEVLHTRLREGANPAAAISDSSKNSSPGCVGPGQPGRSSCGSMPGFSPNAIIDTLERLGVAYTIAVMINTRSGPASTPSTRRHGAPSSIPTTGWPRWPR